jgi:hypothetical protein
MEEGEFMKQFTGSAAANVAFGVLFMLYMGVKRLCNRPSRCKSHLHCCCIDVDVRDQTLHEDPTTREEGQPTEV